MRTKVAKTHEVGELDSLLKKCVESFKTDADYDVLVKLLESGRGDGDRLKDKWLILSGLDFKDFVHILRKVRWKLTKHSARDRVYHVDPTLVEQALPYHRKSNDNEGAQNLKDEEVTPKRGSSEDRYVSIVVSGCLGVECLVKPRPKDEATKKLSEHRHSNGISYYSATIMPGGVVNELEVLRAAPQHSTDSRLALIEIFAIKDGTYLLHLNAQDIKDIEKRYPELNRNLSLCVASKFDYLHIHLRQVYSVSEMVKEVREPFEKNDADRSTEDHAQDAVKEEGPRQNKKIDGDVVIIGMAFLRFLNTFGEFHLSGERSLANLTGRLKLYLPPNYLMGLLCRPLRDFTIRPYLNWLLAPSQGAGNPTNAVSVLTSRGKPVYFPLSRLLPEPILIQLLDAINPLWKSQFEAANLLEDQTDKQMSERGCKIIADGDFIRNIKLACSLASWLPVPMSYWSDRTKAKFKSLHGWDTKTDAEIEAMQRDMLKRWLPTFAEYERQKADTGRSKLKKAMVEPQAEASLPSYK